VRRPGGEIWAGASNYLMKQHMAELLPMVRRELDDARMRRERRQAFAALEQAVSARDEFLSIASHELKTPLTSLRLQAQSLLRAARQSPAPVLDNDQVLRRLEVLDRNAERLTLIVERMLEINRLTSGHMRLSRERIDLAALVRESLATMAEMIREAGCQVALDTPEHLIAHLDRERVMTVLANLLSNAVKYGAGKPVDVALEQRETTAVLRVIDRGIGIPAADQRRIFERFERAVPERHYGGFGVGLWLARQFVVAHGGHIEVESEPRHGSTFIVTLPLQEPA
jgi:signal transduction histidine kinase